MVDSHQPEAPKIEFPCDYPIKIVGRTTADYQERVLEIVRIHAPDLDERRVTVRASSNGNYTALTVTIIATGEAQLAAIFEDLKASGRVEMVL